MEGVVPPLCITLVAGSAGSGICSAMITSYNGGGIDDHERTVWIECTTDAADWYGVAVVVAIRWRACRPGEPDEVIVNSGSQGASHDTYWPVSRRVMGKDRTRSRMSCSSASAGYRQRIRLI